MTTSLFDIAEGTALKQAGLALTPVGAIKVSDTLQTSDKSIYAIGDCAASVNSVTGKQEYWPLGSISTKMGRIAADNIMGLASAYRSTQGTAIVKVFDMAAGTEIRWEDFRRRPLLERILERLAYGLRHWL